jgi:hypothetical protein
METCFNYTEKNRGFFSSDERRWITKIHKLKEQYPERVRIIREPEDNDGCIYCELPTEWLKIRPPREVSDEFREKSRELMKQLRENGRIHAVEAGN